MDLNVKNSPTDRMKVILWTEYGPPETLRLGELPKPVPKDDEILIKVHCATVTAGDCEVRRFEIHPLFWLPLRILVGFTKPRHPLLGQEFSGTVEFVGSKVTSVKPGDRIFGNTGMKFGSYTEYRCQSHKTPFAHIPEGLSFDEVATIPTGGINALHFIRNARVKAGHHILVNGAGGSIGTYAVQIAKYRGAKVTCVDSADKLDMLKSIGADEVLDYARQDFTMTKNRYDAVIDIVGKINYKRTLNVIKGGGILVLGNPATTHMFRSLWTNQIGSKKVMWNFAGETPENLEYLANLLVDQKIKAVMDRSYKLEQVPEAHQYVEDGLKKGNVIIQVSN